mgnify:CR=1 FL=1
MKYCVCVSGKLGFIVLNHLLQNKIEIVVVMTDSHSTEIIDCLLYTSPSPRDTR